MTFVKGNCAFGPNLVKKKKRILMSSFSQTLLILNKFCDRNNLKCLKLTSHAYSDIPKEDCR